MDVSFVTVDASPNDSAGSFSVSTIAKGLKALGHRITMIAPGTGAVDDLPYSLARRISKLVVELDGETVSLDVRSGRSPQGLELVYLGSSAEFGENAKSFDGDDAQTARRVALFGKAAARWVAESGAEAVHGLGVIGALTLAYLPGEDSTSVRILSIDDPTQTGHFPLALESQFGLGDDARDLRNLELLRAGIVAADGVMVPSSAVGRALAGDRNSPTLAAAIAKRGGSVHSVSPGLDGASWNPLTDPHLASRFDPVDRSGKARCASSLCKELGLPIRAGAPIVAVELGGASADQIASVVEAVRAALRLDASVVVRAASDVDALDDLAERWPDRLVVRRTDDEPFVHRLLGAADLWLVASEHPSSSATVLAGLRYGAIPVVSREHPMADRLVDCEPSLRTGTAFLADRLDPDSLVSVMRRALAAFHVGMPFELVRQRAMRIDVSLERMARLAERLYKSARAESEILVAQS